MDHSVESDLSGPLYPAPVKLAAPPNSIVWSPRLSPVIPIRVALVVEGSWKDAFGIPRSRGPHRTPIVPRATDLLFFCPSRFFVRFAGMDLDHLAALLFRRLPQSTTSQPELQPLLVSGPDPGCDLPFVPLQMCRIPKPYLPSDVRASVLYPVFSL